MKQCKYRSVMDGQYYETSCKNVLCFITGDIKENKYKYCPYCGKKIKEVKGVDK